MATFALIPAAGHSRRMGTPKLDLPLGDCTVLERLIRTVRQAGLSPILVVLAPHVASLELIVQEAGGEALILDSATPEMRATIEAGLDWIERRFSPQPADHWLLCPADHPVLDPAVIAALINALATRPDASVAVPKHQGQRGHPTLVSWRHVAPLRAFPSGLGLNAYLRRQAPGTVEVEWPNGDVLLDLDTPDDYAALTKRFGGHS